ncbi:5763_t:CDS:2 [Gigaspora margarita]|uniref:5763_t:CDS:1 n=1 Tax=Gigaspora margarita TaxID=4874 RepID=A0ABN7UTM0_GIGMA|nr:5763_t:CDS:2 [Gigaspora margarita]
MYTTFQVLRQDIPGLHNEKGIIPITNTSQPCDSAEKGALRALSNKHLRKSSRNEKLLKWIDSHKKNGEVKNKNQDVIRNEVSDTIYKWQSSLRDEKSSNSTNKITNVFDKIENSISLSVNRICLTMTHNNMSSLHNILFSLPLYTSSFEHLTHLNFSHNQLSWIPAQIGKLIHLRNLNISYNQVQEIPCQILKIHGLQQLDISNNPLLKENEDNNQIIYHYKSAVSKLSELCYRDILNNNKSILFTKYVTKCNYLPKVIRSTLLEPNKRICAVCDCWHTQSAATLLNFTWVCLVPDVPIRFGLGDNGDNGDNGDSTTNSSYNHN